MTIIRSFKIKGKNHSKSSNIKVKILTDKTKNLTERKIKLHYTTVAEGYQLKVSWSYKCKNGQWFNDALGTSFKPKNKNGEPITDINQLPLQKMLKEADAMAWLNYNCTPTEEYRNTIVLEHYIIAKPSEVNKLVEVKRQKKENIKEYEKVKNMFDINKSYKENKTIANNEKRKIISKDDFYVLRKIINNEKINEKQKKKLQRVKRENKDYIDLLRKVRGYKNK